MIKERIPSWDHCFSFFKEQNISFNEIIDVGAGHPNSEGFLKYYPHAFFHLIEPQFWENEKIKEVYKNTNFKLYNESLDEAPFSGYEIAYERFENGGIPTHLCISDQPADIADTRVISCIEKNIITLDCLFENHVFKQHVFLKIDVDGFDLRVLKGSKKTLPYVYGIQIECSLLNITDIIKFLDNENFQLIDLVDPCYYSGRLTQIDLIFISKAELNKLSVYDNALGKSSDWDNNLLFNFPYMLSRNNH